MKTAFNTITIIFLGLVVASSLSSCDRYKVFEENKEIPNNIWERSNKLKFVVPISDTISGHNVYINIRNAEGFPYSNLFLFVHSYFPDGKTFTDTLECVLADDKGKWLGAGAGDIFDNKIPFKGHVRFRSVGTYTFELEQAMRLEKLPLVMDAGIRIERVKK